MAEEDKYPVVNVRPKVYVSTPAIHRALAEVVAVAKKVGPKKSKSFFIAPPEKVILGFFK